jgi:hypothetical protein
MTPTAGPPHRRHAHVVDDQIDDVARQGADDGGEERLVVLQAATVQDLEGEDGRAERRAEQHGEPGRHAGDGEDAGVDNRYVQTPGQPRTQPTGGLHQWSLRAHAATGCDAQQRDGDQGAQVADVLGAAEDMDVVYEQLHIAGRPEDLCQDAHTQPDPREDEQVHPVGGMAGPKPAFKQLEGCYVRGADEPAGHSDRHDEEEQADARAHERFDEHTRWARSRHATIVP